MQCFLLLTEHIFNKYNRRKLSQAVLILFLQTDFLRKNGNKKLVRSPLFGLCAGFRGDPSLFPDVFHNTLTSRRCDKRKTTKANWKNGSVQQNTGS